MFLSFFPPELEKCLWEFKEKVFWNLQSFLKFAEFFLFMALIVILVLD